ncbi:MAG: DUF4443 domain-containing protein [Promethearchaeota archaeon]
MLEELNKLYISDTIKPTFENVHVILALYIFGENLNGIGRYRLKEELLIGSGTAKSLITRLNERLCFISVLDQNIRKGHVLTERGLKFLNKVKKKIPLINKGEISVLKDIMIDSENANIYFCQVKNAGEKLTNGIEQRDAAIKVGGLGATCLVYDGIRLVFPLGYAINYEQTKTNVNKNVNDYFEKEINNSNSHLEKNDVIIIGLGDSLNKARLVALNAALTLI